MKCQRGDVWGQPGGAMSVGAFQSFHPLGVSQLQLIRCVRTLPRGLRRIRIGRLVQPNLLRIVRNNETKEAPWEEDLVVVLIEKGVCSTGKI